MGITARGAWEAVKRHFREMNRDIQAEPFTAIGIGDMSGDVFGNGMLLSRQTRLLAAFDHRDIFIDPNPDPATSWEERKRLFDLVRVTWQDYDKSLISQGGGVFSRSAKSIPLSPEIRSLTGIEGGHTTPNELIRAILRMQADLLWFGGIGTFVRADRKPTRTSTTAPMTRTRVDASELAREGDRRRRESRHHAARAHRIRQARGGRINTDAIDNSAGVEFVGLRGEHQDRVGQGEPPARSRGERNDVLVSMTDEVARLPAQQLSADAGAVSLGARAVWPISAFRRVMEHLEQGGLDRDLEDLPSARKSAVAASRTSR